MKTYAWIGIAAFVSAFISGLFVLWATQTANSAVAEETVAIYCTAGAASCSGTSGPDNIFGSSGYDNISGFGGNDHIFGAGGSDTIRGGNGRDVVYGSYGNDRFYMRDCPPVGEPIDGGPGWDTAQANTNDWYVSVEVRGEAFCV